MNQDDQALEGKEKIEMAPALLAELKDKARERGLSLFAYLAHFVSQGNGDIRRTAVFIACPVFKFIDPFKRLLGDCPLKNAMRREAKVVEHFFGVAAKF